MNTTTAPGWWGQPTGSHKAHFFTPGSPTSKCGKWSTAPERKGSDKPRALCQPCKRGDQK